MKLNILFIKSILPVVLLVYVSWSVSAQELPSIVTDRPDQTESSSVVPVKTVQFEGGFVYGGDNSDSLDLRYLTSPGLLVRIGVLQYLEVRVGMNYLSTRLDYDTLAYQQDLDGFTPFTAGFKIHISEQKKFLPKLAFLSSLAIPGTGSNPYKIENIAANMRLIGSWSITPVLSAGGNLGIEWNGLAPEGIGFYSAVLGVAIFKGISGFAEFYGFLPERDFPLHQFDAGFTFLLKNNLQLDVSAGAGLTPRAPDFFINTGFAWRVPR